MAPVPRTLYDALGLDREARLGEIRRAYDRLVAEFDLDTTPPDPRREALIREAFAVLSDPQRRADYDRTLETLAAPPPAPGGSKAVAIGAAAAVVAVVALAGWFFGGRSPAPTVAARPVAEILAEASRSVGRMQAFELSGNPVATGVAFAVAPGVMATACQGLAPGAQVVVRIGSREVPARMDAADEALGLCRLAVDGAGSWPLPGGPVPRAGDKVYAVGLSGAGEVQLAEAQVKRVFSEGGRSVVDAGIAVPAGHGGRPLLDAGGRIVAAAVAPPGGGAAVHVVIPQGWAEVTPAAGKP
ncbi:MAG: DnaJ domain-containing protein [Burkholderiales bacterium]|nr:DnaJ domain-containing protein [Burkholderiales bacterium]